MIEIFDSHAHYDDKRFDKDRDNLINDIHTKGVKLIMNVGSDLSNSLESSLLSKKYDFIYSSVGVHPISAKDEVETGVDIAKTLNDLISDNPKIKAIGEAGFDYFYQDVSREEQDEVFALQLQLSKDLNLPIIIHSREATQKTMDMVEKYSPKGIVHCFSGSVEVMEYMVKKGLYIGFTGVVTFKNAKTAIEVIKNMPLDRLLIETDCPYMAPEPFRGERCDSSMLTSVINKIAEIRGETAQKIAQITFDNAKQIYNI